MKKFYLTLILADKKGAFKIIAQKKCRAVPAEMIIRNFDKKTKKILIMFLEEMLERIKK